MNHNVNISFTRQTVLNFRFMDTNAMTALATDLALPLTVRELVLIRDHFRTRERRDPMIGELQLLSAYAARWKQSYASVALACKDGEEESLRVFADMLRMRDALGQKPATLSTLMNAATEYLARSGMLPYHNDLFCGSAAEMAMRAAGELPTAVLELDALAAMRAPAALPAAPQAQMLLLLHPTGTTPFAEQIAKFLSECHDLSLSAVAVVGNEGVLPHLLASNRGFFLDLFPFPAQNPAENLATVNALGQGDLLFLAPEASLSRIFASGAPVTVCGALTEGHTVQIRRSTELYLSLSTEIFSALQSIRICSIRATRQTACQIDSAVTENGNTLLGGVTVRHGCAIPLLNLIGDMLRRGADPDRMTLTALLEMPTLDAGGNTLEAALSTVAELHRTVAELVLPCHAPIIREHTGIDEPTLTVFACAERIAPRTEEQNSLWAAALAQQNYAALRRLLRPTL